MLHLACEICHQAQHPAAITGALAAYQAIQLTACLWLWQLYRQLFDCAHTLLYTLLCVVQCGCMTGACLVSEGKVAKACTNGWHATSQLS